MAIYDQCTECKRLIPQYAAEMQASMCPPLYTFINGNRVCWQCADKMVTKYGVVEARPTETGKDSQ